MKLHDIYCITTKGNSVKKSDKSNSRNKYIAAVAFVNNLLFFLSDNN
ncbi:MAG: hypothetical protein RLY16_64 [Bacteroidota bacterium]|jgi:hypothetical protein